MNVPQFICPNMTDGHLDYFQFGAMVNNTAVNILYMTFGGESTPFSWINTQK